MEFDKSKGYTALNADELEPGDVVFVADTSAELKQTKTVYEIKRILDESVLERFVVKVDSRYTDIPRYALAYLIAKHDDPYKEFKKAYAEGKEVWLKDYFGEWSIGERLDFSEPVDHYSLTEPKESVKPKDIFWKDFNLGDHVEYDGIDQLVSAIDTNGSHYHIFLSCSKWIEDDELKNIKRSK